MLFKCSECGNKFWFKSKLIDGICQACHVNLSYRASVERRDKLKYDYLEQSRSKSNEIFNSIRHTKPDNKKEFELAFTSSYVAPDLFATVESIPHYSTTQTDHGSCHNSSHDCDSNNNHSTTDYTHSYTESSHSTDYSSYSSDTSDCSCDCGGCD